MKMINIIKQLFLQATAANPNLRIDQETGTPEMSYARLQHGWSTTNRKS